VWANFGIATVLKYAKINCLFDQMTSSVEVMACMDGHAVQRGEKFFSQCGVNRYVVNNTEFYVKVSKI
jgi:hypothetical protein